MRAVLIAAGLVVASAVTAVAQSTIEQNIRVAPSRETAEVQLHAASRDVLDLGPGGQIIVRLNRPFSSVAVGDPEVADVLPRSDRVFVVVGRKVGNTDVTVFDNATDIYKFSVAVGAAQRRNIVRAHKGRLHDYYSYECNPVCVRVRDDFEPPPQAPIIVEGGGGQSNTVNVVLPPGAPGAR